MATWKHKEWETFPGTWLIVADYSDDKIKQLIENNPGKYGLLKDWSKCQKK